MTNIREVTVARGAKHLAALEARRLYKGDLTSVLGEIERTWQRYIHESEDFLRAALAENYDAALSNGERP
jgi:hypothetical protein